MDYSIEVSENEKYLRVVANVDITIEIARKWTSDLAELTRVNGIKKYLFDSRTAKNISNVTENYNFSNKDASKLNIDRSTRQALLVASGDNSHDFIETTKVNAGFDVKIFNDESEAVKWLEEEN